MGPVNKVLLTGRLTRDPELRQLASGKSVATFGIATNEYRTGQEKSEFHNKGKVYLALPHELTDQLPDPMQGV